MKTATEEQELAAQVLERLRLVEVARGTPPSFWRKRWDGTGRLATTVVGVVLIVQALLQAFPHDLGPEKWAFVIGGGLCILGAGSRRDASKERLDALVRILDDNGQLAVTDRDSRPSQADG